MQDSISRDEFERRLATASGITHDQAHVVLDKLADLALAEARRGVTIPGLCRLDVIREAAGTEQNALTGESVLVPARDVLTIRPVPGAQELIARDSAEPDGPVSEEPAEASEPVFITFRCTKCGREIEATTDLAEAVTACPGCGAMIKVPSTSSISELAHIEEWDGAVDSGEDEPETEDEWRKGATIRIEVPKSYRIPRAVKRTVYIKRRK